jgi:RHS repeat-associated protein
LAPEFPSQSGQGNPWYVRVTQTNTTLTVKYVLTGTAPSEATWSSTNACYSSTAFRTGGMIGFLAPAMISYINDLTVKSDPGNTGSYTVTEHCDAFGIDANGYATDTFTYDAAGNLTYDDCYKYSYDAWNRLRTVTRAYRSGGSIQTGSVVSTSSYDGLGRRISKAVTNSADWNCTYAYYHDGQRVIEIRNGSDQAIKQQVWGQQYIDELLQVGLNSNPSAGNTCTTMYWAMQDANWNVMGLVDSTGALKERYEYTPYGQRTVFFGPGSNDGLCYAATFGSRRFVTSGSVTQPYATLETSHQGLMADDESGLIYNRIRVVHPILGTFLQRDPLGYVDNMNLYSYLGANPLTFTDSGGTKKMCGVISFTITFDKPLATFAQTGTVMTVGQPFQVKAKFQKGGCYNPKCCEYRQYVRQEYKKNGVPVEGEQVPWREDCFGKGEFQQCPGHRKAHTPYEHETYTEDGFELDDNPGPNFPSFGHYEYFAEFQGNIIDVCNGGKAVDQLNWFINLDFDVIGPPPLEVKFR